MGVAGQNFLGRNYYLPGSRFAFQARPSPTQISNDLSTIKIIGPASDGIDSNALDIAQGQEPFYIFTSLAQAQRILKKGKLLDAIKLAFAPSTQAGFEQGAQFVKAFNINPNIKASLEADLTWVFDRIVLVGLSTGNTVNDNLIAMLAELDDPIFPLVHSFTTSSDQYVIFAYDKDVFGDIMITRDGSDALSEFDQTEFIYNGRKLNVVVSKATINTDTTYTFTPSMAPVRQTGELSAAIPGPAGNQIAIRKDTNSKTIELRGADFFETSRRLEWPVFSLAYGGAQDNVRLHIDGTSLTITEGSTTHTANLAELATLDNLIGFLNNLSGFTGEALTDTSFELVQLDHISYAVLTETSKTFYADGQSEKLYLEGSGLVSFDLSTNRRPLEGSAGFLYLTGGMTGAPTINAYSQAIQKAEQTSGLFCNLLSTSLADKIVFRDSIIRLNSPDGARECLGGVGGSLTDTTNDKRTEARHIASRFVCYGFSNIMAFNGNGQVTAMDGTLLAVLNNAIMAAQNIQTPTAKALNIIGVIEENADPIGVVRDGALIVQKSILAGVSAYNIVRSVTTEQGQNLIYNESSSIVKGLIMVKELRETMNANFIGAVPVDATATVEGPTPSDIRSVFELKMDEFVRRGFLFGVGDVPAWYRDEYRLVINGDSYYFEDVRGNVTLPINFIFGILELQALSATV